MAKSFRVLIGVCGGVAAYKSAELVRRLRERGHEVRCAMTPSANSFLAPLTLEVLTGHRVSEYRALAERNGAELMVMHTKDEDQLAMHGLAYPLAVELRHLPLLMV